MKITIKFQEDVREDLVRWYRSLGDDPVDCRRIGDVFLEELLRHLTEFDGEPPEAIKVAACSPPKFWWEFTKDVWVLYSVQVDGGYIGRLFGTAVRKITILSLGRERPD